MSYIESITKHWAQSIKIAQSSKANEIQLKCMRDLAEDEFGVASNMRLKRACYWSTHVDKDGDVVLTFIEVPADKPGHRVTVCIDHLAIITTRDLNTGEVYVYNPYDERKAWPGQPMIWVLDNKLLRGFTEPSLRHWEGTPTDPIAAVMLGARQRFCEIVETRKILTPFHTTVRQVQDPLDADVTHIDFGTMHGDGKHGFARLHGALHWLELVHEDPVSRERVFALCSLTWWQKVKAHVNRFLWKCERGLNLWKGWPENGAWTTLPRWGTEGFSAYHVAYCAL